MVLKYFYNFFEKKNFGLSILCFHSVGSEYPFSLNLIEFEKIILELRSQYKFITPEEFDSIYQNEYLFIENSILLTFDDGFKDNLVVAEFLTKLNIKAIFFINGMLLEKNNLFLEVFNSDRNFNFTFDNFLSIDDIFFIKKLGHEIGNHFHSHIVLNNRNLFEEVYKSNEIFAKFKLATRFYALPYGRIELYEMRLIHKLADLGFIIFSMDPKNINFINFKSKCIPRIGIGVPDVINGIYMSKVRGSHRFRSLFKGTLR